MGKSLFVALCFALLLPAQAQELAPGVLFRPGAVNEVLIQRQGKTLAVYGCAGTPAAPVEKVLLTHIRRDVLWVAEPLSKSSSETIAPAAETNLILSPEATWEKLRTARFHDYSQHSTKLPTHPFPNATGVAEGDTLRFADCSIRVLATPGYTRGAVSYLVHIGNKRIAFTGDLLRDDGKLQDLFSLQDAIPEAKIGGYHGWAARLADVVGSLKKLQAEKPDLIIPARGWVISDPAETISRLLTRIRLAYSNYLSIDALRWYFKDEHVLIKARRVLGPDAEINWMPMAQTRPLPGWVLPISNSRLITADDGTGFLIDCGSNDIIQKLLELRRANRITAIEHVFVTHYHDDHTEALPSVLREFGANVHACGSLIDVLENPGYYRLPCLTRNAIKVTAPHWAGDSWRWKEFRLTIFDFPGQTLHHNALLVQRDNGEAILFVGDSFTPSGIDDYCLQNRNILCEGRGYFYCLGVVDHLPKDCLLVNQHVEPAFLFTSDHRRRMRETLQHRMRLLTALLPFDDPNFGVDEGWCTFHPYAVQVRPGDTKQVSLRITNHSPHNQTFNVAFHGPSGWIEPEKSTLTLSGKQDGAVGATLRIPANARPGISVITADIAWDKHDLRRWSECMVEVVQ